MFTPSLEGLCRSLGRRKNANTALGGAVSR